MPGPERQPAATATHALSSPIGPTCSSPTCIVSHPPLHRCTLSPVRRTAIPPPPPLSPSSLFYPSLATRAPSVRPFSPFTISLCPHEILPPRLPIVYSPLQRHLVSTSDHRSSSSHAGFGRSAATSAVPGESRHRASIFVPPAACSSPPRHTPDMQGRHWVTADHRPWLDVNRTPPLRPVPTAPSTHRHLDELHSPLPSLASRACLTHTVGASHAPPSHPVWRRRLKLGDQPRARHTRFLAWAGLAGCSAFRPAKPRWATTPLSLQPGAEV
jgi:hypothetical protein